MKRLLCFLLACLATLTMPVFASEGFQYENERMGIALTMPGLTAYEIAMEESENSVRFYHTPSREPWGGLIGTITVLTPRSLVTAPEYSRGDYCIIAMGKDCAVLWQNAPGGANSGGAALESYKKASALLSFDQLQKSLTITDQEAIPELHSNFLYLTAENGQIRPDDLLTRGELAKILHILLTPYNRKFSGPQPFSDKMDDETGKAAAYLASYGILSGYPDGTFRPKKPVSRAEFAVLLHRCQFAPPVGRYGNAPDYSDIPSGFWAKDYIYSANTLGWMSGYSDGAFHPDGYITRAAAVTTLNRVLGRDESATQLTGNSQPFSDLPDNHWARKNILEAAGYLDKTALYVPVPDDAVISKDPERICFVNASNGWATLGKEIIRIRDKTSAVVPWDWDALGLTEFRSRFPDGRSALDAIVWLDIRPASSHSIYLTIHYRPYESVYHSDFEAVWQTVLTDN